MYVFAFHKSFRGFTVGKSDSHRHFCKKEAPHYESADMKNIFRRISRKTIQLWKWNIAAGTAMGLFHLEFTNYRFGRDSDRTKLWDRPSCKNVYIIWISSYNILTHLHLDKIAAILADDISKWTFLNKNDRIPTLISLKFIPKSPVDNKPTLVQVIAWCRTGDKPLPEPMMTNSTDAYMRHWGEMDELFFMIVLTPVEISIGSII